MHTHSPAALCGQPRRLLSIEQYGSLGGQPFSQFSPYDPAARFYAADDPPPGGGDAVTSVRGPVVGEPAPSLQDPHVQAGLEQARALAKKMLKTLRGVKGGPEEQRHFAQLVIRRHPRFSAASAEAVIEAALRGRRDRGHQAVAPDPTRAGMTDTSVRGPKDVGKAATESRPTGKAGAESRPTFKLADSLLVIAREHGLPSWPKLKAYIIENAPYGPRAAKVIDWALDGDIRRAGALLDASPGLSTYHAGLAAMCGEAEALSGLLSADPASATRPVGHKNWPPLLYLCFSQLHKPIPAPGDGVVEIAASLPDPAHSARILNCARLLLEHGADANSAYDSEPPWEGSKLTALYGATGHGNFPALAALLLEAGANPNDGESVPHCAQRNMRECLELLLAHGAQLNAVDPVHNNTALFFILGYREHENGAQLATQGARWLLEHGADPNIPSYEHQSTALHLACDNNRRAEVISMLLDHGADPSIPRADGRTAWQLALRAGAEDALNVLRERGFAETDSDPLDLLCAACALGNGAEAARLIAAHPDLPQRLGPAEFRLLTNAATQGRTEAVKAMLASGFNPDFQLAGEAWSEGTPLHNAAFHGWAETVRVLIAAGAELNSRDATYDSPPLGWCTYATLNFRNPAGDYPAVLRALLDAGAQWDSGLDPGADDLKAILREYGKLS